MSCKTGGSARRKRSTRSLLGVDAADAIDQQKTENE